MLETTLVGNTTIVAAQDQLSSDLAGEAIILELKSGTYYGLNTVGARIWDLIQQPRTLNEVRDILLEEFEVEPEQCQQDLSGLLQDLAAKGLIEVTHETTA